MKREVAGSSRGDARRSFSNTFTEDRVTDDSANSCANTGSEALRKVLRALATDKRDSQGRLEVNRVESASKYRDKSATDMWVNILILVACR